MTGIRPALCVTWSEEPDLNPPSQGLNPQGSEEGEGETTDSGKTPKPELLPRPRTGSEFLCETTTPS